MKVKIKKRFANMFESDYCYYPLNHTIGVPKIPEPHPFHVFSLMHEMGHAHYKHYESFSTSEFLNIPKETAIMLEEEAWDYAKKCIKPEYYTLFSEYKKRKIGTYKGTHTVGDVAKFIKKYKGG